MKKVFLLATLAVAIVFSSCTNGLNKLPEDLRDIIEEIDNGFKEYFADEDEYEYKGVKVEDKNIVFTVQISKDELDGMSLKKWVKEDAKEFYGNNMSKEQIQHYLFDETFDAADEDIEIDEKEFNSLLKKNKYNVVFRIIGKDADDKVEIKISHKDLPDYDKEEDEYDYDYDEERYY